MRVAIVGGGISGLSAAYYLGKAGVSSVLIEKRPRLGGIIQTDHIDGCLVEGGPDSFLSTKPWALELIRELGLEGEVIGSNDHQRKISMWRGGRMIAMPDGLQFGVPTKIGPMIRSGLLSWTTKARMALDYFRSPSDRRGDCSVSEFIRDHYGQEAVDYLAEPLLAGVYGGVPETLSAASVLPRFAEIEAKYGSLSRGMLAERQTAKPAGPIFRTLKSGLGKLIEALTPSVQENVRGEVETIERTSAGYRLRVADDWLTADQVVLACEAHAAARLARSIDPELGDLLGSIPYHSSTVIAFGFDTSAFSRPLEGFGFLVPRRERKKMVACTFMATKFPFRAPDHRYLLRCFFTEDVPVETALEELREKTGLTGQPLFSRVYQLPRSMAQYTVGHQERVAAIEMRLREIPGLFLTGNGYYGVGIPDCIRNSRQLAERVVNSKVL